MNHLQSSLQLPCGIVLKNRIAKSALSENMANRGHQADLRFKNLYEKWSSGGAGLLITGNVMVDSKALGEPCNVVFEEEIDQPLIKEWVKAGTKSRTQLWVQLNHPGKQSPKFLSPKPVAPSQVALKPPLNKMFNEPRELTEIEIEEIIRRFGVAAKMSKDFGFTGVQIHGAHGYLVSQFLSPHHNRREDQWGGPLENRMRFVQRIYQEIRRQVGNEFPVGIKLNSADFQKGGFTEDESIQVVEALSGLGIDLIEISGGNYESQEMMGTTKKESTRKREAYFLDYCEKVRGRVKTPLMLTGGFRSFQGMNDALSSGACDVIGLGRSIALNPDFPSKLLRGENIVSEVRFLTTGVKALDKLLPLEITWYTEQIHRMGAGKNPNPKLSVKLSILRTLASLGLEGIKRVRS